MVFELLHYLEVEYLFLGFAGCGHGCGVAKSGHTGARLRFFGGKHEWSGLGVVLIFSGNWSWKEEGGVTLVVSKPDRIVGAFLLYINLINLIKRL